MTFNGKVLAGLALLALGAVVAFWSTRPPPPPNILVIMVDDLGFNDLAIDTDNADIDTPNMDRIAREGVRFTRHYAYSSCSPARAAFLTGVYAERLGFLPAGRGISPEIETLADRLQASGYTTWHIGKWHIGEFERLAWPDFQGFDHWFGFLNPDWLAGNRVEGELRLRAPRYDNPWLMGDAEPGKFYPGHLDNILTDKAIDVISDLDAAGSPWFLNLWLFAPHAPIQPDTAFAGRYPDTPAGRYRALVSQLDTNIGRIFAHVDALGALDNTIVVIVSDNGGTNRELDNNAPYYGKKSLNLEGGLRAPLVIRWPDPAINGRVFDEVISIEDIYPTLLEAVGIAPPDTIDGVSYYRAVLGEEPAPRKDRFRGEASGSYGVLSADGRWRLYLPRPTWGLAPALQLFDLAEDPTGAHGLASPPAAVVADLQAAYRRWYRDVHRVSTGFARAPDGSGVLTGMDFVRTPGFGGYTIGFAVPGEYHGVIASQGDTWRVERRGNTLEARFGEIALSGDLQEAAGCQPVVLTGSFDRRVASWVRHPDRYSLSLWIDGREVDSDRVEGVLPVADATLATTVGGAGAAGLAPPVILNTRLDDDSPWTLDAFSEALCATVPPAG